MRPQWACVHERPNKRRAQKAQLRFAKLHVMWTKQNIPEWCPGGRCWSHGVDHEFLSVPACSTRNARTFVWHQNLSERQQSYPTHMMFFAFYNLRPDMFVSTLDLLEIKMRSHLMTIHLGTPVIFLPIVHTSVIAQYCSNTGSKINRTNMWMLWGCPACRLIQKAKKPNFLDSSQCPPGLYSLQWKCFSLSLWGSS